MIASLRFCVLFLIMSAATLSPGTTRAIRATEPKGATLAEATLKLLEGPMTQEFGRPMTGILREHHQSVIHLISIDYPLEPVELDATWAEKVVRALEATGATDVKISDKSDWGPTEVRAKSLTVGEANAVSVQFVISRQDNVIGASIGFLEMKR